MNSTPTTTAPAATPTKTAIITGGNVGLGYECARNLAAQGWHVVLACRNETTAREAAQTLRQALRSAGSEPAISVEKVDLASLASVRAFAERMAALLASKQIPPLRALVNNAGLQMGEYTELTAEGYEMTFGVNHLGHFLLTRLLAPHLTTPARVIFVASEVHDPSLELTLQLPPPHYVSALQVAKGEMPHTSGTKMGQQRYATSKLCNLLATYAFAEHFASEGREISVNGFNPGMMPGTGLARKFDPLSRFAWRYILPVTRFFSPHVRTTEISGRDLARLASEPAFDGITGKYFDGLRQKSSSQDSYNREHQHDLWHTSLQLCGVEKTQAES